MCSIRGKIEELRYLCLSSNPKIDCLCISETHLNEYIPDDNVSISGYSIFRNDRVGKAGGGVMIYAADDYVSCVHKELQGTLIESLWVEFKFKKSKPLLVSCVYRPPKSNISWFESFEFQLHSAYNLGLCTVMTGDFNLDILNDKIPIWSEMYASFNFTQLLDVPTRITISSAKLLDHIYVSDTASVSSCFISNVSLSDHFPVGVVWNRPSCKSSSNHTQIVYRKSVDFTAPHIRHGVLTYIQDMFTIKTDVNSMVNVLTEALLSVINMFPATMRRVKRLKQPLWYSDDIKHACKMRDKYKQEKDIVLYRYWRNKVCNIIGKSKREFYKKAILDCNGNVGKVWKIIKSLSDNVENSYVLPKLQIENVIYDDGFTIVNLFNEYFVSTASRVLTNPDSQNYIPGVKLTNFIISRVPENVYFKIPHISCEAVLNCLKNIKNKKSHWL